MPDYTSDTEERTDTPLGIAYTIARDALTEAKRLWTGPDHPRPDYATPLPAERDGSAEVVTDDGTDTILDGETAAPAAPAWSGQPLEVFHVAPDVLFHEPGAGVQRYLMADGETVRNLEAMR